MQLNKFTDYALRVLLYIGRPRELPYNITEISESLDISRNHLAKIIHFMAKQEWIITTRGNRGGIRLNEEVLSLTLGHFVTTLQGQQQIVECNNPPCVLRDHCGLKGVLDQAVERFYQVLNYYTLEDVLFPGQKPKLTTVSPIELFNF